VHRGVARRVAFPAVVWQAPSVLRIATKEFVSTLY
jgi:hypothetical protein